MDVSPNITRTLKVAAYICLPISGVLAGIAGVFLWLSFTEAIPQEKAPVASRQEANSPLNIIQTNALYLDSFKSAALYETYESAQSLLHARTYDEAVFEATRVVPKKPLLAQIADSMRIVPEAQAGTPASTDMKADKKSDKKGDKKASKGNSSPKPQVADVPAQAKAAIAPVQTAAAATPASTQPVQAAAPQAKAPQANGTGGEAFPDTFKAGTLGQLTQLRAELEQLKMQVTIEETRSKLNSLRGKPSTPGNMPSLDFPPIGMPSGSSSNANVRILSIQSVNGKYTASVGTSQGPKIVSVNDSINGNKVVSITRNSVVINRGQGNETLTIQE